MQDSRPKANADLLDCINENISSKARFLAKLNHTIAIILPSSAHAFRVANYRDEQLVLECASASWLARLNYERLYLLTQLRKTHLPSLRTIEIKVNPSLAQAKTAKSELATTSHTRVCEKSAEHIGIVANCFPENISKRLRNIAALAKRDT